MSLTAPFTPPASGQLQVHAVGLMNGSAASGLCGVFNSVSTTLFKVYTVQASTVDVTTTIQAGTAISTFPTTNNYGIILSSTTPFQGVAFQVSQASTGTPIYTYEYWNGSAWVALVNENTPVQSTISIQALIFQAPTGWAIDANNFYSIRLLGATAPSTAVQWNSIKILRLIKMAELSPMSVLDVDLNSDPILLQGSETIIPFFAYTSTHNRIDLYFKTNT